jgi:hypothetical protein
VLNKSIYRLQQLRICLHAFKYDLPPVVASTYRINHNMNNLPLDKVPNKLEPVSTISILNFVA